jgi:glycosyltransferase involved in cell wall biosynthesis
MPAVRIVAAGWLYDDVARTEFVQSPAVEYRGIVTARESLQLAQECHAVFAFYDPAIANNVNASPNKVYDAIIAGRPVLMNVEVRVADFVVRGGYGLACRYEDVVSLRQILVSLPSWCVEHQEQLRRNVGRACQEYSWESIEPRLLDYYSRLLLTR